MVLPKYASVSYNYLTGQGRAAADVSATVNLLEIQKGALFETNNANGDSTLHLNGYTNLTLPINVPNSDISPDSFNFDNILFYLTSVTVNYYNGNIPETITQQNPVNNFYSANIQAFPGRYCNVDMRVDDGMFVQYDQFGTPSIGFNETNFLESNFPNGVEHVFKSKLADYVRFDFPGIAAKPNLSDGTPAGALYLSGDSIGISPYADSGPFELHPAPGTVYKGSFGRTTLPDGSKPPGTYTIQEPNPGDILGISQTPSLTGLFNMINVVFGNVSTFEVILFPRSADDGIDQIVLVALDAQLKATTLYLGQADLNAGTFSAHPIDQLDAVSPTGVISGTLTNLHDAAGTTVTAQAKVRQGTFTITTGGVPTGFAATGRFVVFRI
ncbi:MAG: hypothetical protein JSS72_02220 [Armatimonadetes bacterium]|nr:hypothetical protein [Armatimonadota bacterium]